MHHSFGMYAECYQMSINVDLQTQNSIDDLVVLYTCRLSWVLVSEGSDHLALELQLEVEIPDHPVSSLRISSAFQQHDVSCESTDCQDMTATCFGCTCRKSLVPHNVHESCCCLTTACDDHWLVAVSVEYHNATAGNPVLPDTVQDSPAGHTKSPMPLHLQHYHHSHHHHHLHMPLKIHNICHWQILRRCRFTQHGQ